MHDAVSPPSDVVQVIIAIPAEIAVITPELLTVAMSSRLLVQDTALFVADAGDISALTVDVLPTEIITLLSAADVLIATATTLTVGMSGSIGYSDAAVTDVAGGSVIGGGVTDAVTVGGGESVLGDVTLFSVWVIGDCDVVGCSVGLGITVTGDDVLAVVTVDVLVCSVMMESSGASDGGV